MKRLLLALLLLAPTQGTAQMHQFNAGVHYSWLALGGGNYSTDLASTAGFGIRASYAPAFADQHVRLTASYTRYPRHRGSTPPIATAGLEFNAVLNPQGGLQPYLGIGVGHLRFSPSPTEFPPCEPELGCMAEGAPIFRAESYITVRPVLGAAIPVHSHLSAAGEFRLHLRKDDPWNGSNHHPELTVGLSYLLR